MYCTKLFLITLTSTLLKIILDADLYHKTNPIQIQNITLNKKKNFTFLKTWLDYYNVFIIYIIKSLLLSIFTYYLFIIYFLKCWT